MAMITKLSLSLLITIPFSIEAATYRWIDAQGNTNYSYSVPASDAQQGYVELNKSGMKTKIVISSEKQKRIKLDKKLAKDKILADKKERKRLSEIAKRPITRSRQHYLMLRFPDTFAHLVENEIIHDYTMGYADYPGFRAGTCSEYPFYNLQNETLTKLIIHPFTVMDATLNKYRNESPEQAIKSIKVLMDEVREVDGTFISLWHNESLSEKWHWKGWRKVYEEMLKMV